MLRSERHVALNPAEGAASSGHAAATILLITSGGKSVSLARELLVTTMMPERGCYVGKATTQSQGSSCCMS